MKKIFFALVVVFVAMNWSTLTARWTKPTGPAIKFAEGEVVLYSTAWCGYCKATRELFAREGVSFVEHDIETSEHGKKMHKALNGNGVPLIEIRNHLIRGFDQGAIMRALREG